MKVSQIEVELLGHYGSDLEVVNSARVSFKKRVNTMSPREESLIRFLARGLSSDDYEAVLDEILCAETKDELRKLIAKIKVEPHHSPFNHAFLSFRVKAPIFVARQLVKHKFMPWNEVSRRYVDDEPEFYFPDYWRKKADNVKQGSGEAHQEQRPEYSDDFHHVNPYIVAEDAVCLYDQMIQDGYCAEQARMVLPQNTMTEWVWSGTLGAFLDMLVLRLDSHTQKETREVAEKVASYVKNIFPVSYNAYLGKE